MKIYLEKDYAAMSRRAANIIAAEIHRNPSCVLGLATGSTPIGTYQNLVEMYKAGDLSFKDVITVNLDEYLGLPGDHDQSYRYFMNTNLFDHVDINKDMTFVPDGLAEDAAAECADYDDTIEMLGYADLQLLGLGHNGHIGFNEPDTCFTKETHVVDLTESTITANSRLFEKKEDVPRQALTMGVGCIMMASRILMVVNGEGKADAVYNAFCGPITPACSASLLQLHPDVVLGGHEAALSKLIAAGVIAN